MHKRKVSRLCRVAAGKNSQNSRTKINKDPVLGNTVSRSSVFVFCCRTYPAHHSPATRKADHVLSWESMGRVCLEGALGSEIEFCSSSQNVMLGPRNICVGTPLGPMHLLYCHIPTWTLLEALRSCYCRALCGRHVITVIQWPLLSFVDFSPRPNVPYKP